ncbi:Rrf2 family transcriptional regulator [Alkalibaculum sp. M08DMB]|uniref:Rrf2 family transcriptional regulator n=1 Tax=Alkalibaculum sporogenes TaxID=2655001 RepID=A0A6A7K977_9FIRM|nr:Rrf2 family transcriptional regulator [Alkalibaculum sporogenes]MPW25861.1 Rrf2 family transcriptional regulator [Alkalibaculum sporogenes]
MKITQEADYALRIVLNLSKLGMDNRIDAKSLSEEERIPTRFTLKILRKLTQGGITRAYRGVHGGYALNQNPQDLNLKIVIELIDGPICVNRCVYDKEFCNLKRTNHCSIHHVLGEVKDLLTDKLESVNFKDLLEK